jgi:hypothetical protein
MCRGDGMHIMSGCLCGAAVHKLAASSCSDVPHWHLETPTSPLCDVCFHACRVGLMRSAGPRWRRTWASGASHVMQGTCPPSKQAALDIHCHCGTSSRLR